MSQAPPVRRINWRGTHRMIATRYPSVGILDEIAAPDDLDAIFELEGWTNDRISGEVGLLHTIPKDEWVVGPMATVIMGAFCHPRPDGARFNDGTRGAWYCARSLGTAHAEAIFHRTAELEEIGWFDAAMQMADYRADFRGGFHDLRGRGFSAYLRRADYRASQQLGSELREDGSNGIVYPSVRDRDGICLACFRPRQVSNVRLAGVYEYRWSGTRVPAIRKVKGRNSS
jgi:RES domain-containing protein